MKKPPTCPRCEEKPAVVRVGPRFVCWDCMEPEREEYMKENEEFILMKAAEIIKRKRAEEETKE